MTSLRVAMLAALYGTFAGMLANVAVAFTGIDHPRLSVFTLPLCTTLSVFALFRLTFAHSWNRRARRLSAAFARADLD